MNYSEMSDFEIDKAVGDASGVEWANLDTNYHPLSIWQDGELCVFCPCTSWADAGPIIEKNLIDIEWGENKTLDLMGWVCASALSVNRCSVVRHDCLNPLRAAMIVFLMMQDTKTC